MMAFNIIIWYFLDNFIKTEEYISLEDDKKQKQKKKSAEIIFKKKCTEII